jgi:hypothetical protein
MLTKPVEFIEIISISSPPADFCIVFPLLDGFWQFLLLLETSHFFISCFDFNGETRTFGSEEKYENFREFPVLKFH